MKGQIDAIVVHLLLCLVQKNLLVFLRGVCFFWGGGEDINFFRLS
jgi:hypothetical protein